MSFTDSERPVTAQDYVDALIGVCEFTLDALLEPPFYTARTAENLSILTQFFLATANIYCRAHNLSTANFGQVLDASGALSMAVARQGVASAWLNNTNIEDSLLDFVNRHQGDFGLTQALTLEDMSIIKQQFIERYTTIKDSPHFDEFMVFDATKPGKFVSHQGAICTDFCEFYAQLENSFFVQQHCRDFATMPRVLPHQNESVAASIDLNIDLYVDKFLHFVAYGQQDETELLLTNSLNPQALLQAPGRFTDYSGRTFHCTAYEYAYWAKDTHMCRMLERHMDDETKAEMLARIDIMEATGLAYQQNGEEHCSAHFDLTPLIMALEEYLNSIDTWYYANNLDEDDESLRFRGLNFDQVDAWYAASNPAAVEAAWSKVGLAQRDVPAHVAQEYCREDRAFYPTPQFNEPTLPRSLTYLRELDGGFPWFRLGAPNSGPGSNCAILRIFWGLPKSQRVKKAPMVLASHKLVEVDLNAIIRLDEVRTADLALSREHLTPPTMSQRLNM